LLADIQFGSYVLLREVYAFTHHFDFIADVPRLLVFGGFVCKHVLKSNYNTIKMVKKQTTVVIFTNRVKYN
jgi:hypothetical protein